MSTDNSTPAPGEETRQPLAEGRPTYEHCAIRYLDQWLGLERPLHEGLNATCEQTQLDAVVNAVVSFGVARSLPRSFDAQRPRFSPVRDALRASGSLLESERCPEGVLHD